MEFRRMGRSGLKLSAITLGSLRFGNKVDEPTANDRGLNRKHLRQGIEESLRRLQTDYIDIYYLHEPDYTTSIEESLGTLSDLVREGKVLYIGLEPRRPRL